MTVHFAIDEPKNPARTFPRYSICNRRGVYGYSDWEKVDCYHCLKFTPYENNTTFGKNRWKLDKLKPLPKKVEQ